jgi:hypothetical protein
VRIKLTLHYKSDVQKIMLMYLGKALGEFLASSWRVTEDLCVQGLGLDGSKGRAPLFLGSKQNLNPSSWRIWHINNCKKHIRNEKVMAPQSKGGQKLKKDNLASHSTKADSQTPKKFFVFCFVVFRVQGRFVWL